MQKEAEELRLLRSLLLSLDEVSEGLSPAKTVIVFIVNIDYNY